jgi:hypothetical protein
MSNERFECPNCGTDLGDADDQLACDECNLAGCSWCIHDGLCDDCTDDLEDEGE